MIEEFSEPAFDTVSFFFTLIYKVTVTGIFRLYTPSDFELFCFLRDLCGSPAAIYYYMTDTACFRLGLACIFSTDLPVLRIFLCLVMVSPLLCFAN